MMRLILLIFIFTCRSVTAQELFVFTEPASNMPAKSIGIRMSNHLMDDLYSGRTNYMLIPEIMWGLSKRMMVQASGFLSNRDQTDGFVTNPRQRFVLDGGAVYIKYRFYSKDAVHSHFRMAAFGRYSFNNSHIHEYAIDLNGHNTGYEWGLVATQLRNKIAYSASASYMHAMDNGAEKFLYGNKSRNAVDYTLSVGKLMLPREYTSYKQTNMNLMVEMLGQTNLNKGYSFLDIAPSVQFIFLSRIRFDAGYRYPLVNKLHRTAPKMVLLRLEYHLLNAY